MTNETTIDWKSQLLPNEIGEDNGTKFVYLKGLRRLAKIRGIKSEKPVFGNAFIWETAKKGRIPFVQMGYEIIWNDGSSTSAAADAHLYNIADPDFGVYPTAICESRAEARCIRKALGIDMVSKEELGYKGAGYEMTGCITPQQTSLIKKLMSKKKVDSTIEVIKMGTSRDGVSTLEELTFEEAQQVLRTLN